MRAKLNISMRTHACEHVNSIHDPVYQLQLLEMAFKEKSISEVTEWLKEENFSDKIVVIFKGELHLQQFALENC